MMHDDAYFIAPSGDVIPVDHKHIVSIIANPEKFRMTRKEIEDIYAKHKERMGLEGKAREEILATLMADGWIRLRYIPAKMSFTAQLSNWNKRKKDQLYAFANMAIEGIGSKKYRGDTDLRVLSQAGDILAVHTLQEVKDDVLFKEASKVARLVKIEDYNPNQEIVDKVISKLK